MMREIVIDTETTGLDPTDGHRIVELGAVELARISHRIECIGAANQRKSLCRNNSSPTHGAPRCRQSVAQISLNLHPWKDAKCWPRSTPVRSPRMPVRCCWA